MNCIFSSEKDKSLTTDHCKLQTLIYEIFNIKNSKAPEMLTDIFAPKEINYNLRNSTAQQDRSIKTIVYSLETISSLEPKITTFYQPNKKILYLLQQ